MIACILGFSANASAQSTEPDESNPLITVVSGTGTTQLTSNCTWKPEKGNDNYLDDNNAAFYDADNHLGTLIDGSVQTYWHSDPNNMNINTQDCYIQVDFMRDDLTQYYLSIHRREDLYQGSVRYGTMPKTIIIKATNTPDDESSWKTVTTLDDVWVSGNSKVSWPYTQLLTMPEAYRYLRLYFKQGRTTENDNYAYVTFSELQFYPAKAIEDFRPILSDLCDSIYTLNRDYRVGTEPGYVSEADSIKFYSTLAAAEDAYGDESLSQDDIRDVIANLRNAIAEIQSKTVPLPDGCYFIKSAFPSFTSDKAWYADGGYVKWKGLDEEEAYSYFDIRRQSDGNYTVRCVANNQYIYWVKGDAYLSQVNLPMADTDTVHQVICSVGNGKFLMYNTKNSCPYHPLSHGEGSGSGGYINPASVWDEHSWIVFQEADSSNVADMVGKKEKQKAVQAILDSLKDTRITVFKQKNPTNALITSVSQLSSNCVWTSANDVDALIDGKSTTHFHSTTAMNVYADDEYLQIDLARTDISKFIIEYTGRGDGEAGGHAWHDTPNNITIMATNDPNGTWKEIASYTKGFPGNGHNAYYISPVVDMKANYQYVRMYVKGTTSGNAYWNLCQFQMYGVPTVADESTMYAKNASYKAAIDNLETALATADEHISNLALDGTEVATVNQYAEELNNMIAELAKIQGYAAEAEEVYNNLFYLSEDAALIKEVNTKEDGTNQMWSNCTWTTIDSSNDNYSFNAEFIEDGYNLLGALIDNDASTYWHSDPNSFNLNSSDGYLQIDLKSDNISNFKIKLDQRNDLYQGSYRHGCTPTGLVIYGTNDATIGTDVNSDMASWTEISTVSGIPAQGSTDFPFYSNLITTSQPYRYLRAKLLPRVNAYVTFAEFQVYGGAQESELYDNTTSQYYSINGMKDVADNMKTVLASVQQKLEDGSATVADGEALKSALEAVKALYQDRNGLEKLVQKAETLIENTTIGDYFGQLEDETLLESLEAAAEAAKTTTSSTDEFKTLWTNLENGIEAVYDGIKSVEEGKWYYILSATNDDDSAPANYYGARDEVKGAALYVLGTGKGDNEGSYNSGHQLRWGMDDIKGKDRAEDIDAIWRFIPVPDSLGLGKRVYYIQNMRTGLYVSEVNTVSSDYYINQRFAPQPYKVEFIGSEQFNIKAMSGAREGQLVSFGDNARQVRLDAIASEFNNRASFTFEEFDIEENPLIHMSVENNSANIVTLPFEITDFGGISENSANNVHAYGIHSQPSETTLGLVEKNDIAAGEPFILVVGDTTQYVADTTKVEVYFPAPTDLVTVADTVNGLVGAMNGATLSEAGFGYFKNTGLFVTDSAETVSISAHSGYINSNFITTLDGEADVVISTIGDGIINNIRKALVEAKETVNVYTVDGVLVKRNVKAAKATAGLPKGMYIVGKNKVLVK